MYNIQRMNAQAARPSTRDTLLDAGRAVVLADGFAALTVRKVATAARANLGSFVYHFGTRDAYVRELIETWYAPVMSRVTLAIDSDARPIERLRTAILQLIEFGAEQELFVSRVIVAAAAGDAPARAFLGSIAGRHPRLIVRLIRAAQADGTLVRDHPIQVLLFIFSSVGLPRLLATAWQGQPLFGRHLSSALIRMARDRERTVQRLDWALQGLSTGAKR
jgi:TetR/AcrR family transcriptional repressor of nem operon